MDVNVIYESGEVIGETGESGNASDTDSAGPHLHLTIVVGGVKVDPETYLSSSINNDGSSTSPCN